jgi:hypothetical protein
MTLLDVLGITTDEVPLAVGAYFDVFHASALKTCAAGGHGYRTGSEDGREARMYQDRCHGLMHSNFFMSSPCRRTSSATRCRVVQPISEVRCPKTEDFTVTCQFNPLCRSVNNLDKEVQWAKLDECMIRFNILASAPQLLQCRPPARQLCCYPVLCLSFTGAPCPNCMALS